MSVCVCVCVCVCECVCALFIFGVCVTIQVYNLSPCAVETDEFGLLHQSCPTVYKMVLEELALTRGDSFLNVGSGSG